MKKQNDMIDLKQIELLFKKLEEDNMKKELELFYDEVSYFAKQYFKKEKIHLNKKRKNEIIKQFIERTDKRLNKKHGNNGNRKYLLAMLSKMLNKKL